MISGLHPHGGPFPRQKGRKTQDNLHLVHGKKLKGAKSKGLKPDGQKSDGQRLSKCDSKSSDMVADPSSSDMKILTKNKVSHFIATDCIAYVLCHLACPNCPLLSSRVLHPQFLHLPVCLIFTSIISIVAVTTMSPKMTMTRGGKSLPLFLRPNFQEETPPHLQPGQHLMLRPQRQTMHLHQHPLFLLSPPSPHLQQNHQISINSDRI
jgi:hypothetical protein